MVAPHHNGVLEIPGRNAPLWLVGGLVPDAHHRRQAEQPHASLTHQRPPASRQHAPQTLLFHREKHRPAARAAARDPTPRDAAS